MKSIVIVAHGFVHLGDVTDNGTDLVIENCQNVRQYGTTKGLGQLAIEGLQENTKLDNWATLTVPRCNVLGIMPTNIP